MSRRKRPRNKSPIKVKSIMKTSQIATVLLACSFVAAAANAQQSAQPAEFKAGLPLGVTNDGKYSPVSSNVKVFGSFVNTESCSYDESRDLIVAVSRGADQRAVPNDGFVSLIN